MPLSTYSGPERLVLAIDVGTTMSAVSFAHLEDGEDVQIRLVTRWPGQEDAAGDCKVPSVVRYDETGTAVQFGAEAVANEDGLEDAPLVKWFKLHLHPATMRAANNLTPPALPPGIQLEAVYKDMLGYLFTHARRFIETTTVGTASQGPLWDRFRTSFDLCLAIPNGWSEAEQGFLRNAVVAAGILPQNHPRERLRFVSESEAAVHFALAYVTANNWLRKGTVLAVCDAGGSTVDTTIYRCTQVSPTLKLEEVTASECVQAGSALLDQAAERLLNSKLATSKYGTSDMIQRMVSEFERKTKRKFDGGTADSVIQFGHNLDNDPRHGIRLGRIKLTSEEVKSIFSGPTNSIARSIQNLLSRAGCLCEALVLVGGFGESVHLQNTLTAFLRARGVSRISLDEATKKAAAEGAVAWYAKEFVVARAARATYGTDICRPYQPLSTAHRERENSVSELADGTRVLPGFFSALINKNTVVNADESRTSSFRQLWPFNPTGLLLRAFTVEIYRTDADVPGAWCMNEDGSLAEGIRRVCTLRADLSGLTRNLKPTTSPSGREYWGVSFAIEVFFGQTSLTAAIVWKEEGQTRKGPVTVIPNSIV